MLIVDFDLTLIVDLTFSANKTRTMLKEIMNKIRVEVGRVAKGNCRVDPSIFRYKSYF